MNSFLYTLQMFFAQLFGGHHSHYVSHDPDVF